jgi:Chaperone of endosialidase
MKSAIKAWLAVALVAGSMVLPVRATGDTVSAIRGTIAKLDSATRTAVVKTQDGTEYTIHFADNTAVHGMDVTKADSQQAFHQLKEGSEVAVQYVEKGSEKTAVEVGYLGKDGIKLEDGRVAEVRDSGKTVASMEQTFDVVGKDKKQSAEPLGTHHLYFTTAYHLNSPGSFDLSSIAPAVAYPAAFVPQSPTNVVMNPKGPQTGITATVINSVVFADQFSGTDAGAKISAAITAAVAAGTRIVDARGLSGTQSSSNVISIPANITLLLGHVSLIVPQIQIAGGADGGAILGLGQTDQPFSSGATAVTKIIGSAPNPVINFIGGGVSNGIQGWQIRNLMVDGADVATYGIYLDTVQNSIFENISIRNTTVSAWFGGTSTKTTQLGTVYNLFAHLRGSGNPQVFVMGSNVGKTADFTQNTFLDLHFNYGVGPSTGDAFDFVGADDNYLYSVVLFRESGSGKSIRFRASTNTSFGGLNNVFWNLFIEVGTEPICETSTVNAIYGYDQSNQQGYPTLEGTAKLAFQITGQPSAAFYGTVLPNGTWSGWWNGAGTNIFAGVGSDSSDSLLITSGSGNVKVTNYVGSPNYLLFDLANNFDLRNGKGGAVLAKAYFSNSTPGVSAGPLSSITSIQSSNGIVTTLTGTSDAKLKTNIHPFERGLDDIIKITPVTYQWNETGQKKTGFGADKIQAGFTAQDVQKAIPEAVGQEDGYLSLADRPIIAALVNAIKELTARVRELEQKQ